MFVLHTLRLAAICIVFWQLWRLCYVSSIIDQLVSLKANRRNTNHGYVLAPLYVNIYERASKYLFWCQLQMYTSIATCWQTHKICKNYIIPGKGLRIENSSSSSNSSNGNSSSFIIKDRWQTLPFVRRQFAFASNSSWLAAVGLLRLSQLTFFKLSLSFSISLQAPISTLEQKTFFLGALFPFW